MQTTSDVSGLLQTTVSGIYAGPIAPLPPDGQRSGIFKRPLGRAEVGETGIVGDRQADRRFHGGPEKALHQFALTSYARIRNEYPALQAIAVPGSIGENLSSPLLDDSNVCIGDCYAVGEVLLQVSQPRNPCWKINHKFGVESLAAFVERQRLSGWYYRVLKTGTISLGDKIALVDRPARTVTIANFNTISKQHRPSFDALETLIECEGLSLDVKTRLHKRLTFLRKKG